VPGFDKAWDEVQTYWDEQHFFLENTLFLGTVFDKSWDEWQTYWDEWHIL
jgi:hypothetical protein